MKTVYSNKAPNVVGPYSQAIDTGTIVFCSGQIGIDPAKGALVDGIENQVNQVMKNLLEVLQAAGLTFDNVAKTTIFLADMNDYIKVNEIYGSFFTANKPARSTVQVAKLPLNARIEIEAIAVK